MPLNQTGASLLELLIAGVMLAIVAVSTSLFFPKAAANLTQNRRQLIASQFAAEKINTLKTQPYPLVELTSATAANFPISGIGAGGCDCSREGALTGIAPDATFSEDGITYTRRVCIHLVEGPPAATWTSYCPDNTDATDKGMKNIRVVMSWSTGATARRMEMESLISRQ